ncbi:membrane protein insertase YidC [Nocardia sp. NEAU-G5]|uniref:Membrane protein insertase YidC n=1 Tax=Nocardia albiluteola TaxID=2842303 RepID=A0ABS6B9E5_9NOCA|nr:membrane protein insertase YidC [Nocardia albiluteola]MBU3066758.1 membrane protein insertase YidC [Nocardia albiluteola]
MLDVVYYPLSAVLWLWHSAFTAVLGAASGLAWALAIVLFVLTLRAALFKPFVAYVRFQRTMSVLRPKMKELQARHADDRERLTAEMRALQKQHEFSVFSGCLPIVAQMVVFLGLFHVLASFDRTGSGSLVVRLLGHPPRMSAAQNAATANYLFSPAQVQSYVHGQLFTAPLSATLLTSGAGWVSVAAVAIPLVVLGAVCTHLTARASVTRQTEFTPQTRLINLMTMWLFPVFTLAAGLVMPVGILVYFATSNAWTYLQQLMVHRRLGPVGGEPASAATDAGPSDSAPPGLPERSVQ